MQLLEYILPVIISGAFSIITIYVSNRINQRETDKKLALDAKRTEAEVAEKFSLIYDRIIADLTDRIQDLSSQVKASQEDIRSLQQKISRLRKNIETGNRNILELLQGIRLLIAQLKELQITPAFEPRDDKDYLIESNGHE